MIIKCPQCATGYNIPDHMLGDSPRRMRCAKCKNMFAVTRRSEDPPSGYVEYTGAQQLPPEFAFLKAEKEGVKLVVPPPSQRRMAQLETTETTAVGPAPKPPVAPPPSSPLQAVPPQAPDSPVMEPSGFVEYRSPELAASVPSSPAPVPQAVEPAPSPAPAPASPRVEVQSSRPPRRQGGSVPVGNSIPAESMFGGNSRAWEVEAPLELDTYTIRSDVHPGHQLAGKVIAGIFIALVGFLIFVAARNGWNLSIPDLPEQIAFAFSSEAGESLPAEVENMDVTVMDRRMVLADDGTAYLSVGGEVFNNNMAGRSHIILRGRLYDSAGDLRAEARMPCGRAVDDKALKATPKGTVAGHFSPGGTLYNCQLSPDGSTLFQVIFENVPADYDATFEVKVMVVAATTG